METIKIIVLGVAAAISLLRFSRNQEAQEADYHTMLVKNLVTQRPSP